MSEQYRQEHKYAIDLASHDLLCRELLGILQRDAHADLSGRYEIRSLYFDDADFNAFREKNDGVMDRSKLRMRYYNFNERYIILEKKERKGDLCRKTTERITLEQAHLLNEGKETGGGSPLLEEYDRLRLERGLHPAVIVDYTWHAFSYPISNVRVTLDSKLRTPGSGTDFFDKTRSCFPVMDDDEALIELKYDYAAPDFIRRILAPFAISKIAMSKYTRCISIMNEHGGY